MSERGELRNRVEALVRGLIDTKSPAEAALVVSVAIDCVSTAEDMERVAVELEEIRALREAVFGPHAGLVC